MPDKSYVTLEQKACPICREVFDSGALLLDQRLRSRFERHTVTGYEICPKCTDMGASGYIALVGANSPSLGDTLRVEDADYVAEYLWLKRSVADQIFNVSLGPHPFVFIEPAAIQKVKDIVASATQGEKND